MTEQLTIAAPSNLVRTRRRSRDQRPFGLFPLFRFAVLIVVSSIVLLPLFATAIGGFKGLGELRTNPLGLPHPWQWRNYLDILESARYWRVLGNSLLISCLTVAITVALSAMAAFAFAHLKFFGRRFLFTYMTLGLMFPIATAILPLFIRVRDLGLLDTPWGVILPQSAFYLAMAVLLLRNGFRQLPSELLDAALVDGCGYVRYFLYVTLPLSRPILSTVAIITFVQSWNNYIVPLIMLNSESLYPWPLGLMAYEGEYMTAWQLVLAFITLTIMPAIIMFILAQKHIVAGLTAGAVKG
jgi:raffinose/stachyose/melibiose transport system permease protein